MKNEPTYLIVETNGKVKKAERCLRLNAEFTRNLLHHVFPDRSVLSPLERPVRGPVQVVNVYISRERNGIGRISPIEQWGIE